MLEIWTNSDCDLSLSHALSNYNLLKAANDSELKDLTIHYKICPISLNENKFLLNNPEFVSLYLSIEQTEDFPIGIKVISKDKNTRAKTMKKLRSNVRISTKSIKDLLDEELIQIEHSDEINLSEYPILTTELILKAASNSFLSASQVRYSIL